MCQLHHIKRVERADLLDIARPDCYYKYSSHCKQQFDWIAFILTRHRKVLLKFLLEFILLFKIFKNLAQFVYAGISPEFDMYNYMLGISFS